MQPDHHDEISDETDVAALSEIALDLYKNGALRKARKVCERILQKEQRPAAVLILAKVAHRQGKLEEAIEGYEQFLRMFPEHEDTHFHLGVALDERGRTECAIEHYEEAVRLSTSSDAVHRRLGDAYGKLEKWDQAIAAYRQAIAIQPEDDYSVVMLGNAFIAAQRPTETVLLYEQALKRLPGNARLNRHLGVALLKLGRMHDAIDCFERSLELEPEDVSALADFARTLLQLGRAEEAIVPLEQAINAEPEARIGLAMAFRQLGMKDDSVRQLEQLLALRPSCTEAHYHLSMIQPEPGRIAPLEDILRDSDLSKSDAVYIHFALGNLYQSNQSFDQAFDHFEKANALQRDTFEYDADHYSRITDRQIQVYSSDFFDDKRGFGSDSELPVFIVGMPRSGTTLVEQVLSSHPLVHGAGELETIRGINHAIVRQLGTGQPPPECMSGIDRSIAEKHAAAYLGEVTRYCPSASRITDKFPGNYVAIGLIKTLLPEARIVHCQRNALDNCISLYCQYFPLMPSSFELTELAKYYLDYQRLMSHWRKLFGDEIFTVQYEDLVADQERVSRQLVDYVGLDWDERCLDFEKNARNVSSPSNMQVRQPIYKSSINRWKHYESHLQPLIDALSAESDHQIS